MLGIAYICMVHMYSFSKESNHSNANAFLIYDYLTSLLILLSDIIYIFIRNIFTLRIESARITIEKSLGEMYKNPLPFLGLPGQRELGKELSKSHVQRVSVEVEISQIFFGYRSTKIVAETQMEYSSC